MSGIKANPFAGKSNVNFSSRDIEKRMQNLFKNPDIQVAFAATAQNNQSDSKKPFLGGVNTVS